MADFYSGSEIPDSMFDAAVSSNETPAAEAAPVAETPEPAAEETPAPEDPGTPEEPAVDPAAEPEPAADEEPAATDPAAIDELPEGATLRMGKGGKEEIVYSKERGLSIYAGYKTAREAEQILGEPLTAAAIQDRQVSHEWFQNQRVDAISPDPRDQGNVFTNIFLDAAKAISDGEIGHDPLDTMPEAFLNSLRSVSPEHYAKATAHVMQGTLQDLYREAATTGDKKLLNTVQNLDFKLNGTYVKDDEVKSLAEKPIDKREQDLQQREQAIERQRAQQRDAAYRSWNEKTVSSITTSVQSEIDKQIPAAVKQAFESTPEGQTRLKNMLRILDFEVRDAIRTDQKWLDGRNDLFKRAKMAPSEQMRGQLQTQIVQRYVQKARMVLAAKAANIISAESAGIKNANAANHKKLSEGATQRSTPAGTPALRRVPDGPAKAKTWEEQVDLVFG